MCATCMPSRTGSVQARTPGRAVDLHEAVRALAGAAHQAARAVVLERAGEGAPPGGEQRRADRVALERLTCLPSKVNEIAARGRCARRGAAASRLTVPAAPRSRTSLVRVSRSARNQAPAAGAMEPPLALHARHVAAEVVVRVELALGGLRAGRGLISPPKPKSVTSAARSWDRSERGHETPTIVYKFVYCGKPGIQLVPASGTRAIAAASTVSATRSSGSRLCTCDLPQARASVCVSSVIVRR